MIAIEHAISLRGRQSYNQMFAYDLVFQDPDFYVPKGFTNVLSIAASALKILNLE